ncbi:MULTISPECIES: hypothetical protein [unclassified Lacinutrix]|uniref:hypothetical protein n=1 Tax=unclassified Lacinutrix TaxID=2647285 RepID=UPI0003152BB7|nr:MULTISPECIES: hypothetical protein [unclassified Lacinutrix]
MSLLQLSVPQVPLFLQPLGWPSLVEQLAQAIYVDILILNVLCCSYNALETPEDD